jgi:antitoxin ParD1/3/4
MLELPRFPNHQASPPDGKSLAGRDAPNPQERLAVDGPPGHVWQVAKRFRHIGKRCQIMPQSSQEEPSMATMNVSLPDPMKDWVEAQARTGRYSNASDYVRDLIRRDQERAEKIARLQQLLTEGLESGVSTEPMDDIAAAARAGKSGHDL